MSWQDAPIVKEGVPSVHPAWMSAPVAPPPSIGLGDVAKGVGDAALSGVSKVATGVVGGGLGLVNRLVAAASGGDPELAAETTKEYVNQHFGHDTTTPVGQEIGGAVSKALAPIGNAANATEGAIEKGASALGVPQGETQGALHELGEIANVAPIVGGVVRAVRKHQQMRHSSLRKTQSIQPLRLRGFARRLRTRLRAKRREIQAKLH